MKSGPEAEPEPYTSRARVLLNGLGADELLGGYGRHRTAFKAGGWPAVIDEVSHRIEKVMLVCILTSFFYDSDQLQLDIDRIPTRNLGRDDRMISAHGKETRFPFLCLSVVNFLVGDKMLLRLAAWKMGLVEASTRKKRAMQFGSHAARMEVGITNGGGTVV